MRKGLLIGLIMRKDELLYKSAARGSQMVFASHPIFDWMPPACIWSHTLTQLHCYYNCLSLYSTAKQSITNNGNTILTTDSLKKVLHLTEYFLCWGWIWWNSTVTSKHSSKSASVATGNWNLSWLLQYSDPGTFGWVVKLISRRRKWSAQQMHE